MTIPAVRRITHTATAAQTLATVAQIRLPRILNQLTLELETFDGYPAHTSGSDTGPAPPFIPAGPNASTSSTEHAALTPDYRNDADTYATGPRAALDEIQDLLNTAVFALELVIKECDRRTPPMSKADLSRLRCAGTRDHQGATCTQYADPARTDGRCVDCGRTVDSNARRLQRHKNGNT